MIPRSTFLPADRQALRDAMTPNGRAFCEAYAIALGDAIRRDPTGYVDTPESAIETALAERMTLAYMRGSASFGAAARSACLRLGVAANGKALRAFLNAVAAGGAS